MLKKFVTINSNASPSKNPYEVRTFMGENVQPIDFKPEECNFQRVCDPPPNSTISKVKTLEEELRRLHKKAKENIFQRPTKRQCLEGEDFTMCVLPLRTPKDLKKNLAAREQYIMMQQELSRRVHDGSLPRATAPDLVQLNSPVESAGEEEEEDEEEEEEEDEYGRQRVKPKLESATCSMDFMYIPSKKLLELKRPKSGMFHNKTEEPIVPDDDVPYQTYNPREMLKKMDTSESGPCYDIIEGRHKDDLWTWNLGFQKNQAELDQEYMNATIPKLDCEKFELAVFKIPKDLGKTFTAEMVFGNEKVLPEVPKLKPSFYNRPNEIACMFIAYVESFRLSPDFWTAETMDAILLQGDKLITKSVKLNYKSEIMDFDILPTITEKNASIGLKVHFTGPLHNEPNIYKVLSLYFSKYNAAVFCAKNLYLLIWKRCSNSFYIFDPNGRNELCQRDFFNGKCSLLATRYVEHLVHLIDAFSQADTRGEFNLYEIFLNNFGKITIPVPPKGAEKMSRKLWAVVNRKYAIIPAGNNGLQQPISGNEQNPSMIISLLALLYSDIERAVLWRMEVIDDLIKFGQAYYKTLLKRAKLKKNQQLNIIDLPEMIMMGAFKATLKKRPFMYTGHVADCKSFTDSQLTLAVRQLFESQWEAALLQIDNSFIAIWRDMEYFYLFDPFRRGKAGQVLDPEDFLTKGVACLQMHTDFQSFCRILYLNALKMRRGGKFFLHGINVGCIKPVIGALAAKNKYARLQLSFPQYKDEPPEKPPKPKKGKKGRLERKYSIHTIPSSEIIPEFEDADVVESVLHDVLCDIFNKMSEPTPMRPNLYKQAQTVLLRSDQEYLKMLQYKLKHGEDYDNIYAAFQTHPDQPNRLVTLEEELKMPSNFDSLPDGSWVILGITQLPVVENEMSKLGGLLSGFVALALSAKYKISTWNSDLIDYALESADFFGEDFKNYQYTLGALLEKKLPRISIGHNIYLTKVMKIIKPQTKRPLREILLETLISYSRLIVLCHNFSCVIIKRLNFLYMFIGFPCNSVGYRKFGSGPGCLLRFVEMDSLIKRIEFGCNPQGCEITNYVVVTFKVMNVTEESPERYKKQPDSEEMALYQTELGEHMKLKQRKKEKMRFLDEELRKEDARINKFMREKDQRMVERQEAAARRFHKKKPVKKLSFDEDAMFDEMEGENELVEEEEEEEIELQHKPGKRLKREIIDRYKPRPVLYGYRMRAKDCLFKIQGTTALDGRDVSSLTKIKPCFFVSTLAVLYAILRPLNQWNSQRIDRVLENGMAIAIKVTNMNTACDRIIKNVSIDDYEFDIWVKTFEPVGNINTAIERKLLKATHGRHYLLLQMSNVTYAIYRDEYFHLFDPYGSMELAQREEEEDDEDEGDNTKKKVKCPKGFQRYGERNTASWVLFADVNAMVKYIDARTTNSEWRNYREYKFHVVDVISYKKAKSRQRILQLLTDLAVPMQCNISQHGEDESTICAYPEMLSWLELENCLPAWSRLNRRNTGGRYRNLPLTKLKKFDIEIEGRLWSLWGNLHPNAPVFEAKSRGKQSLACNVLACCMTRLYHLTDWSSQILDSIVISGDKYHRESLSRIKLMDYEFSLEDLNLQCSLEKIKFNVHLEHVVYGRLYCEPTHTRMNLSEALMYFFSHFQFGILQARQRSLAIGRTMGFNGGYFMFDCQSQDGPLFPKGQGAAYVLRTKHLQVLLYCIVVTLNVSIFNMQFTIHKVEMLREGASFESDEEEEEEVEEQ